MIKKNFNMGQNDYIPLKIFLETLDKESIVILYNIARGRNIKEISKIIGNSEDFIDLKIKELSEDYLSMPVSYFDAINYDTYFYNDNIRVIHEYLMNKEYVKYSFMKEVQNIAELEEKW